MRQGRHLIERIARKKMTPLVVTSILFTAVLHGGWNAAKVVPDRLAAAALIGLTGFAVAVAIMIGAPVRLVLEGGSIAAPTAIVAMQIGWGAVGRG